MVEKRKEYDPKSDPEVIEMKLVIRAVLITAIVMLLITTFLSIFVNFGYGDLGTSAPNDIKFNFYTNENIPEDPFSSLLYGNLNVRNITTFTDIYDGLYSFTGEDIDNNGIDISFVDTISHGYTDNITLIDNYNGHDEVLKIYSDSIYQNTEVQHDMSDNLFSYGNIEFWVQTNDSFEPCIILGYFGVDALWGIGIDQDNFRKWNGGWSNIAGAITPIENVWYYISIDYECSSFGYDGLSQYEFNIEINGIEYGDYAFGNNKDFMDILAFSTSYTANEYNIFFDAIGYSGGGSQQTIYAFDAGTTTGWTWAGTGSASWGVIGSFDGETNVLRTKDSTGGYYRAYRSMSTLDDKVFECDIAKQNVAVLSTISLRLSYNSIDVIRLEFAYDDLYYYNPTQTPGYTNFITNNNFFHLKIVMDDNTDTYDIWIDGTLRHSGLDYLSANTPNRIDLRSSAGGNEYSYWDNFWVFNNVGDLGIEYEKGDNLLPDIITDINSLEVDRYEWGLRSLVPFEWVEFEDEDLFGWDNYVVVGHQSRAFPALRNGRTMLDSRIQLLAEGYDAQAGIKKDFTLTGNRFNITYSSQPISYEADNGEFITYINSSDTTNIVKLMSDDEADFYYWNGDSYVLLENNLVTEDEIHHYNIYIDYYSDTALIKHWEDDVLIGTYMIDLLVNGKEGLGEVNLNVNTDDTDAGDNYYFTWIDYIGIYQDGRAIVEQELGYALYDMGLNQDWDVQEHYLIYLNASGTVYLAITEEWFGYEYQPILADRPLLAMILTENTTLTPDRRTNAYDSQFYNAWGETNTQPIFNPFLVFFINGTGTFNDYYNYSIEGVYMSEGINNYTLQWNSENIDDQSYFYAFRNRLYYTMTTDDNDLEYISAVFDISSQNQNTFNYTLLWGGLKTYGNMDVEFRINYDDSTYTPFPIKTVVQHQNAIIPQGLILENFELLITDNDNDAMGVITGYIEPITLIFTTGAIINVIISDYLSILTPILLIVIITITIWETTKKKVKTMLIAPTMVFMTFSTFLMALIPLWILFVVIFANGIFLYSKWEDQFSMFSGFASILTSFLAYAGIIDFWLFYMSFMLMVGYTIFVNTGSRKG